MDVLKYAQMKQLGLVTLTKIAGGTVAVAWAQFDPDAGARLPDRVEEVVRSEAKAQRDAIRARSDAMDIFLEDLRVVLQAS